LQINTLPLAFELGFCDILALFLENSSPAERRRDRLNVFEKALGYGPYLIKRICEAYGWAIQETGKEDEVAGFAMIASKMGKDGKKNLVES
jgi:hypothetical protein